MKNNPDKIDYVIRIDAPNLDETLAKVKELKATLVEVRKLVCKINASAPEIKPPEPISREELISYLCDVLKRQF